MFPSQLDRDPTLVLQGGGGGGEGPDDATRAQAAVAALARGEHLSSQPWVATALAPTHRAANGVAVDVADAVSALHVAVVQAREVAATGAAKQDMAHAAARFTSGELRRALEADPTR